jgi:hypothetical protein
VYIVSYKYICTHVIGNVWQFVASRNRNEECTLCVGFPGAPPISLISGIRGYYLSSLTCQIQLSPDVASNARNDDCLWHGAVPCGAAAPERRPKPALGTELIPSLRRDLHLANCVVLSPVGVWCSLRGLRRASRFHPQRVLAMVVPLFTLLTYVRICTCCDYARSLFARSVRFGP